MKPHPRIRKTVKWAGAAATVLLAVLWIGSNWWHGHVAWTSSDALFVNPGTLDYRHINDPAPRWRHREVQVSRNEPEPNAVGFVWWLRGRYAPPEREWFIVGTGSNGRHSWTVYVIIWPFAALSLAVTATAWLLDRSARRAPLNLCPNCHYDRTGLPPVQSAPSAARPMQPCNALLARPTFQAQRAASALPWASAHGGCSAIGRATEWRHSSSA